MTNMKKNRFIFSLFVFLLCLFPVTVNAEIIEYNVCIRDSGAFHVKYDTEVATGVKKSEISNQDILDGHVPYPEGITEDDKKQYEFTATRYSNSCYVDDTGSVQTCPSASQISKYKIYETYGQNQDDYVTITLRDNGNFDIKIKALYDKGLNIRIVPDGNGELNTDGEYFASRYAGQFSTAKGGYYNISNVVGSSDTKARFITLEFYVKESGNCNGVYLGAVGIKLPNANDYKISNPALSSPDFYGCTAVKNYVPDGMTKEEQDNYLTPVKKQYIYECYDAEINFGEKDSLKSTISSKLEKLKNMFSNYGQSTSTSSSDIICENIGRKSGSQMYSSSKGYWIMTCTENYTAQGDEAKLVIAGNGFEYQTDYSISRTCSISYVGPYITKKPQCQHSCFHRCYWNSKSGVKDGWDGGPNDDFDQCVLECDGGKYTQSCINSCYSSVYQNNRDISFSDKFGLNNTTQNNKIDRLAYDCITENDNNGTSASNSCGQNYCVSDYCQENGWCENYEIVFPSGCSDNPQGEYNSAISAIKNDLGTLTNIQTAEISVGNYTYKITDSYLETENNEKYEFTVDSINDPAVSVDTVKASDAYNTNSVRIGSDGDTASYYSSYTKAVTIKVNLPLSYVNRVNSTCVYKTTEDSKKTFSINHKKSRLDSVTDFTAASYYHEDDERKYYTNVFSDNINVIAIDDKIQLDYVKNADLNIAVTSSDVGNSKFSSNIKCYYGVYNNFYIETPEDDDGSGGGDPNPPVNLCNPETEICDGGIQWIYRPIDLTDVFPNNRDPRWNWTGTVNKTTNKSTGAALTKDESFYNDIVDPTRLIEEIQSKGENIYNVSTDSSEIDYEFVLTRENINNIRNYNKSVRDYNGDGENNYLDYNMSCYKNSRGQEVCTSKFLDNINGNSGSESNDEFITYSVSGYGIDARKSLAGCNNAINGTACDYFSK